jgi:hypothetical protein
MTNPGNLTRLDWLVVIIAVLTLPGLYIGFWGDGSQGLFARVQIGNQAPQVISLQQAQQYRFQGPLGATVIEVHDGHIRFIDSPCSGKQCVHSGWLKHDGEFAACLPNLISISLSGPNPRFDSINF